MRKTYNSPMANPVMYPVEDIITVSATGYGNDPSANDIFGGDI